MAKGTISSIVMRILITLLGVAFIFGGFSLFALGLVGEKETAVITSIRRQGGERNEVTPNRYTYIISYTFKLPNGKKVDGFTTKIGNSVYIKKPNYTASVRYFAFFPFLNSLEADTESGLSQVIYIGTGRFLIYVLNKPKRKIRHVK